MKTLTFHIDYHTRHNEHPELACSIDGGDILYIALQSNDQTHWTATLQVADQSQHIRYAYQIVADDGTLLRVETNTWRLFAFNHRSEVCFCDAWADTCLGQNYHRAAFEQCLMLPRGGEKMHLELFTSPYLLLLHTLPPANGMKWAVVGNTPNMGEWQPQQARIMQRTDTYEWALPLTREDFEQGMEYKYVLVDAKDPAHAQWEEGGNRIISPTPCSPNASIVRQDERPRMSLPQWRGAGCVIPVFSLRSKGSMGIGDFGDLDTMIRWGGDVGMKAIQLLPINDTTRTGSWHDSYPYNGISVFALHPAYLDLREWRGSKAYKVYSALGTELNALSEVDYERAFKLKMDFAHALYKEGGAKVVASAPFKKFCDDNAHWLPAYTTFCTLRDTYHTADFRSWPDDAPKAGELEAYTAKHPDVADSRLFYAWLQYLLHRQMQRAHNTARELGVILKGDIPIGISRDSVPAWADGHLFHFDGQAGAPPDDFAVHGQNWGFPTYNWEVMAQDGYLWWRSRLKHMEQYFDAYRIDHVLGFFRIWEVPSQHIYGLLGQFRPALPYTEAEIHDFGFGGDVQALCVPRVTAETMQKLMTDSENAKLAADYFTKDGEWYVLKEAYRSQRAICRLLPEGKTRQTLLQVVYEVLFIRDATHAHLFHPRVGAQRTWLFDALSEADRQAFNHLHDHFFYERNNQFWADEAMKKVPAVTQSADAQHPVLQLYPLNGNGMLPCAEDLGMVPASVKGVLERLEILSLEIQRMPKAYGVRFGNPLDNSYLSVATIATHDMPPLRLWWQQNGEQSQAFWHEVLHHNGEAPAEATPEVCEEVVKLHLQSPSMLCLLGWQDWLAISPTLRSKHPETEQINVPANPDQYWQYRMHLTLEELIQATGFNDKVRALIAASGRLDN